ncbi:MAG: PRC-barrel domain-containing protein [Pseudolabrys sp.]|nr:PRC-barrel domain-containing protein [Pseudolabrys sp.]
MKMFASAVALSLLAAGTAMAAPDWAPMGSAPADNFTVKNYYNQSVYDRSDNKIGTIDDVLLDKSGHVSALIIGVGGFLGIGEKDVAAKFQNVQMTKKNDKWYLVMDTTKDDLKAAPGYKYDSKTTTWVADANDKGTMKR